jgi:hypothetical protein
MEASDVIEVRGVNVELVEQETSANIATLSAIALNKLDPPAGQLSISSSQKEY